MENNEILGGLEETGLSKYESSAYYNLLGKGLVTATEIAYCSNLPRQKIYSVLKKLESKKLVLINYQKPLMCRAIPPKEAFKDTIIRNENKLNSLKKTILTLQKINEEGLKNKGIEEKKYFVLNHSSTTNAISDLITKSKESIEAMINPWGFQLLTYFKKDLVKSIIDGKRVRIICDLKCDLENNTLPKTIEQKNAIVKTNIFIFDNYNILILDNNGAKSALIYSNEILLSIIVNQFNDLWNNKEGKILEVSESIKYIKNN
jgi:HTH-type transcriptional regulator, sugar sensing transcriptional regulator